MVITRHALIKNGIVERVILLTPAALEKMDPCWRAQWDRIEPVRTTDLVSAGFTATVTGDSVAYAPPAVVPEETSE